MIVAILLIKGKGIKLKPEEQTMYQIKCTPNYYSSTCNAPQAHLVSTAELGDTEPSYRVEIAEFETEEEAQSAIDSMQSGTYYLSHGEAGRPGYEIVEDGDYGPDCIKGSYDNEIDTQDIPDDILKKLDNSNVEYSGSYGDEYDTYSYTVNDDEKEKRYGIHFTVSTVATQVNSADLGNINWDNATYTCEKI